MGIIQIAKGVLGLRSPRKPAAAPKRKRSTRVQMESRRIAEAQRQIKLIEIEVELNAAKRRAEMLNRGEDDGSWREVLKEIAPELIRGAVAFANANRPPAPPSPATAEPPKQIGPSAAPAEEEMDEYSKQVLPYIAGKSPDDAARWLHDAAARDPLLRQVVQGLTATAEEQIPSKFAMYGAVAPSLIAYCRQNGRWFLATLRILKAGASQNGTPAAAIGDPGSVAL